MEHHRYRADHRCGAAIEAEDDAPIIFIGVAAWHCIASPLHYIDSPLHRHPMPMSPIVSHRTPASFCRRACHGRRLVFPSWETQWWDL